MSTGKEIETQAVFSEIQRLIGEFIGLRPVRIRTLFEETRVEAEKLPRPEIIVPKEE